MTGTLQDLSTIRGEEIRRKVQTKRQKKNIKGKFYHSFFTLILLFLVVQISYSAILNISKSLAYRAKIHKSNQLKTQAEKRNERLKNELYNYDSMQKVEAIARNNLKMAGEGEVLVIINQGETKIEAPKTLKDKLFGTNVPKKDGGKI